MPVPVPGMADKILAPTKSPPTPIVVLTDPGQDLDDEMAFIIMSYLRMRHYLEVRSFTDRT